MAIDFRRIQVQFAPGKISSQHQTGVAVFDGNVRKAEAALSALDVHYHEEDHHLHQILVVPRVSAIKGPAVFVEVEYLLRDWGATVDELFEGTVDIVVLADVGEG